MGGIFGRDTTPEAMQAFLSNVRGGAYDEALVEIGNRQKVLRWHRLPKRIVLLRHGESEGNVNRAIYTSKGDGLLELTPKGLRQAEAAGQRLAELVGDDRITVAVSPFERTQQTLLALYQGGLPEQQVRQVHMSSQIREQEFGNFQTVGLHEAARAEQALVGRFYYRRPNAESSADVYDRVSAFWESLLSDVLLSDTSDCDTCLIVTHGLTIRLLLMTIFRWSVETFETVWNVGNGHHITLSKNVVSTCYKLDAEESYPAQIPWATRPIWLVFRDTRATPETERKLRQLRAFKEADESTMIPENSIAEASGVSEVIWEKEEDFSAYWTEIDRAIDALQNQSLKERSKPYTVLDYLNVQQPRTTQTKSLKHIIEGHQMNGDRETLMKLGSSTHINWDNVEFVDWWGNQLSYQGKMLRTVISCKSADMQRSSSQPLQWACTGQPPGVERTRSAPH